MRGLIHHDHGMPIEGPPLTMESMPMHEFEAPHG